MKRLLLPTPTSRRQRGFFRATAVLFSAALVSVGIVTTQQVKAHQYSHAKHVLAIKKLAIKDCGCGILLSKSHSSKLYQAAASTGADNFEHAVSLKAGQRLALGVSDPTGAVQPGGTWSANFGTIDASGIYTAPSFTPPEGLDRLHYTDPNSNDIWINVRVLPNPAIPNSDQTPYVTFDYLHNNAMKGGGQTAQAQQAQREGSPAPDQEFAPTSQTIVEMPGDTPAPPEQVSSATPLVAETIDGESVLTLPALDGGGDPTSVIYAQPLNETPQNVTLVPEVLAPTGPCTSGETSSFGPYSDTPTPQNGMVALRDVTVSAELGGSAFHIFNVKLTVGGTYHVQGQFYNWKRTRTKYVWVCSRKRWVLEYTKHCDSYSLSLRTTPPWAILAEGYPQNNQPILPFGGEGCHP